MFFVSSQVIPLHVKHDSFLWQRELRPRPSQSDCRIGTRLTSESPTSKGAKAYRKDLEPADVGSDSIFVSFARTVKTCTSLRLSPACNNYMQSFHKHPLLQTTRKNLCLSSTHHIITNVACIASFSTVGCKRSVRHAPCS